MEYTLKQLAEELNVTRQTIYKRASGKLKNELESYVFSRYNTLYYTEEGADIIRNDFKMFPSVSNTENKPVSNTESSNEDTVSDTELIRTMYERETDLLQQISVLQSQLSEKTNQLHEKELELVKAKSDSEHSKETIEQLNQRIADKDSQIDTQQLELTQVNNERKVLTATLLRDTEIIQRLMSLPLSQRIFKWKDIQKSLQNREEE